MTRHVRSWALAALPAFAMKKSMKTGLFFARAMALALVAGGIVASLPTEAMAANRTWTNASTQQSGNRNKWGTTTATGSNWTTNTNPTSSDTAVFLGNNGVSSNIAIQSANVPVGKITFSGTTQYNFTANAVALSGDGSTPNVGISNGASGETQTFAGVSVNNTTVHANSTAGGILRITSVDLQGNYFAVGGDATVLSLTGVAGSTYEAKSGSQSIDFANGNAVGTLKVSGGTVNSSGDSTGTILDIQGGSYAGNATDATFLRTSITSGNLDLSGSSSLTLLDATGASYSQGASGLTKMDVGYDGSDPLFSFVSTDPSAGFTLGGGLLLDGAGMTSDPLAIGLTWNLFQGVNFTSGSASPLNNASNFSSLVLADSASGSPYAGTFTQFGEEWISPSATDGTYLVFQAASGNLAVVPEPSTYAMALAGLACGGYAVFRRRRIR